jgi:hypothetical protein
MGGANAGSRAADAVPVVVRMVGLGEPFREVRHACELVDGQLPARVRRPHDATVATLAQIRDCGVKGGLIRR